MPRPRPDDVLRFLIPVFALPAPVLADGGAAVPGLGWMALRAGASLALVLVLIVALAFLFRRLRAAGEHPQTSRRLASLERLDLGARREIRLVRVDDRRLLVGVTGERISLLSELPADASEAADSPPPLASGFRVLRKLTSSS